MQPIYVEYPICVRHTLAPGCSVANKQKNPCPVDLQHRGGNRQTSMNQSHSWELSLSLVQFESSPRISHNCKCIRCSKSFDLHKIPRWQMKKPWLHSQRDYEAAWGHTAGKWQIWGFKPRQSALTPKRKHKLIHGYNWCWAPQTKWTGCSDRAIEDGGSFGQWTGRASQRRWHLNWRRWQPRSQTFAKQEKRLFQESTHASLFILFTSFSRPPSPFILAPSITASSTL